MNETLCEFCGETFQQEEQGRKKRFCSDRCRLKTHRAKSVTPSGAVKVDELPPEVAALLVPASSFETEEPAEVEVWMDSRNLLRGKRLNKQHPRIEERRTALARRQRDEWLSGLTQRTPQGEDAA